MNRSFVCAAFAVATIATLSTSASADMAVKEKHNHADMKMSEAIVHLDDLEITSGFARATLPNAPVGGGYVSITNNGQQDDVLISATSNVSDNVQLHNMRVVDDVMKMYEMEGGIPLPAGETITLAPGGLHIMFMQLKQQLVEGSKIKVTLTFENAGTTDVELDVKKVGAKGVMSHQDMSHKNMPDKEMNQKGMKNGE